MSQQQTNSVVDTCPVCGAKLLSELSEQFWSDQKSYFDFKCPKCFTMLLIEAAPITPVFHCSISDCNEVDEVSNDNLEIRLKPAQ